MAETGDASDLPAHLVVLASEVHSKLDFHKNAYSDYIGINNALHRVIEERGKLQQEQNAVLQLVATKEELTKMNEEQAAEIESLKEKLQASGLQHNQSGGVQTRSMQKRKRHSLGHDGEDADEHELMEDLFGMNNPEQGLSVELEDVKKKLMDIRSKLIKGFHDIDNGGRNIGIKNMGQLSEKPFQLACLEKLPHKEAEAEASELCYFWQEQLMNPEWNPFKTVTVGGIPEEIINVDDDKLQELQAAWGEGVCKAVLNGLMEMKECGRLSDRTIVPELWNFKEKRKATLGESVEYMCSQVKRLSYAKGRTSRREKRH